jgi:hypothetical protein
VDAQFAPEGRDLDHRPGDRRERRDRGPRVRDAGGRGGRRPVRFRAVDAGDSGREIPIDDGRPNGLDVPPNEGRRCRVDAPSDVELVAGTNRLRIVRGTDDSDALVVRGVTVDPRRSAPGET